MTSIPSLNVTPRTSFGNWLWPSRRRQLFCAASSSLKTIASAVLLDRHPFDRTVRWRTVAKALSIGLVVRRCFQCSAGSRRTPVACPDPCPGSRPPSQYWRVALDEGVERQLGGGLGFGHPDLLQRAFAVAALSESLAHVGVLAPPRCSAIRPVLAGGLPQPSSLHPRSLAAAARRARAASGRAAVAPVLRALAGAIGEADQFLAAFRRRANQHQGTASRLRGVPGAGCHRPRCRRSASPTDHAFATRFVRQANRPSVARWQMPTTRQHPCRAALPRASQKSPLHALR